jgi:hypothetical protein
MGSAGLRQARPLVLGHTRKMESRPGRLLEWAARGKTRMEKLGQLEKKAKFRPMAT